MKAQIINARITSIESNSHRLLHDYPYCEHTLNALKRSIADVGLWEGVIARKKGNKYELAFGHHRIEAARQSGLNTVALIVKDLNDEQMLQYMGRENLEEYNTDFLRLLNSWEAAVQFAGQARQKLKDIDVARILGWTELHKRGDDVINQAGATCAAAYALIQSGHCSREQFEGLSVKSVRDIVQRALTRMEQIEKLGKQAKRTHKEIEEAKTHVAKAAKKVASDVKAGKVKPKEIASQVDFESYDSSARAKKQSPLFAVFGAAVEQQIRKMLNTDSVGEKLEQISSSINKITMEEDLQVVRRIDFELSELAKRSSAWRKKLIPTNEKVIAISNKLLPKKEA